MVHKVHQLPRTRRCELLDIPRSSSYYHPQPVSEEDKALMRLIDRIHLEKPYLGSRRIVDALTEHGHKTDRKRVQRLNAAHGHTGNPSWAKDFEAPSAAQDISIPAEKPGYQ